MNEGILYCTSTYVLKEDIKYKKRGGFRVVRGIIVGERLKRIKKKKGIS